MYEKLEARGIKRQRGLFDTIKYNALSRPVTTKYIRIRPVKKENGGFPFSLRLELYGCAAGKIVTVFPQLFSILSYSSCLRGIPGICASIFSKIWKGNSCTRSFVGRSHVKVIFHCDSERRLAAVLEEKEISSEI